MTTKVHEGMYGDSLEIESGGVIIVKSGGRIDVQSGGAIGPVQGAALTAQLTTITPADAAGTPDYAIAAVTATAPYGFVAAAELITVLYVIKNLQTRLAEVEARLEAAGVVIAN